MRVHLYTQSLNEAAVLGFFFRHYDPWVERYVVFDDGSTDGTLDLLAQHGRVEVRRFERVVPDSFVASAQKLHDSAWKESRGQADWVVITAIDEHLYHPRLSDYLRRCRTAGVNLIPALGYEMIAVDFPPADALLCRTVTQGVPSGDMNKLSLFNPDEVRESRFGTGRHLARPAGELVFPARDELLLLHYKSLGMDYLQRRQTMLAAGLGARDTRSGWGVQYSQPESEKLRRFNNFQRRAINVTDPGRDHHGLHEADRWWRPRHRFVDVA